MFMELYYEHYMENCRSVYWNEPKSLPYAVRIPDKAERADLERILNDAGFSCVVHENEYPVMYVNFTLKRYGRNVKACRSSTVNETLLTKEQFLTDIFAKYQSNGPAQK